MSPIPDAIRATIPPLYATESVPDPVVRAKLFTPWTRWTWYVIEWDGSDLCFGLVEGFERELGYFSLKELDAIRGPGGLRIELDEHFKPLPLSELKRSLESREFQPRLPSPPRER